jgi:hypothetical protein
MCRQETGLVEPSKNPGTRKARKRGERGAQQKKRMKAATIDRFGPPSVLKEHEIPRPEPKLA